jgi:hypothetical protein
MKNSKLCSSESVLEGEVIPPASAATDSVGELSPAEFLAQHGIRPPKPKSYASFAEAMRAIVAEVIEEGP